MNYLEIGIVTFVTTFIFLMAFFLLTDGDLPLRQWLASRKRRRQADESRLSQEK